jgi:hypothetical protein
MSDPGSLSLRRRDEEGDWHDLEPTQCPLCGCTAYAAKDDPDVLWEPGRAWDEGCSDRSCRCHQDPVLGAVRS